MTTPLRLGTAAARAGKIQYGQWDAFTHPTGQTEWLPVIIAQGKKDGPCIWLTAGIHGPEHTGPTVLYKLLTPELVDDLQGTIVMLPALSPAGLRTMSYVPHHEPVNPNRLWPSGRPEADPHKLAARTPTERAFARLFEEMRASADFLIDYHNAWIGSLSFAFRDRVLFHTKGDVKANQAEAEKLAERQMEMLEAYGHTIITELPASKYIDENYHRATSGAALLLGRIPALTLELGTGELPDPAIVRAAVAGTRNVLRWAGMLNGDREPIDGIQVVNPGYRVRHNWDIRAQEGCIVLHTVEAGDMVKAGQPIAEVRDVWGRPLGEGVIRAEHDGFVIGRAHGIYFYPGQEIIYLAIPDNEAIVAPFPDDYYK